MLYLSTGTCWSKSGKKALLQVELDVRLRITIFLNFQGLALVFITIACSLLCLIVGQCLAGKGAFVVVVCCENLSLTA